MDVDTVINTMNGALISVGKTPQVMSVILGTGHDKTGKKDLFPKLSLIRSKDIFCMGRETERNAAQPIGEHGHGGG
jgi:hypothetical protein